ncbi:uncharacterized protein FOMMEDRAFT_151312 [Fomitiporia mediterranea MF3/22]|uniref:uncharacterized protein n=1 Tax=Fomitiporia mediterranea (strain MF3/22) TaxID=694068 RepID=UPI0004407DEA|nr:uncharacterized protein FOMMEDRAFT_151312 [Fomitiporia mediterranea MF3/22]EJD08449.1 hypothetical protein FOMMEDRAFT_151312 [Fomitiporia mediterranea MF3/22]
MSVRVLTAEEIEIKLQELYNCLLTLPDTLPLSNQFYNFKNFDLEDNEKEDYGTDGAVNRRLEVIFCPSGRQEGIQLKERGPGLEAVVGVLQNVTGVAEDNVEANHFGPTNNVATVGSLVYEWKLPQRVSHVRLTTWGRTLDFSHPGPESHGPIRDDPD